MFHTELANRLKFLRQSKNYTQQYVAHVIGVERSTYAYYETAKSQPSLQVVYALSKLYKVSTDYIISGE